jgi:hypothetical protein
MAITGRKTDPTVAKKAAKTKDALITEHVVRRILSELGAKMTAPVKGSFVRCLEVLAHWYSDATLYNHGGPQKQYRDHLFQLSNAIGVFSRLLDVDQVPSDLRGFLSVLAPFGNLSAQLGELNTQLARIAELRSDSEPRTGVESDFVDLLKYQDHFKERSPADWLAGVYLPELYYLFFGFESGWGQGPKFLSFADIVLRAMKVKTTDGTFYTTKAISRAVRVKPDISRRRKKGPLVDNDIADQLEWYRHMHLMGALGLRHKSSLEHARKVIADLNIPSDQESADQGAPSGQI